MAATLRTTSRDSTRMIRLFKASMLTIARVIPRSCCHFSHYRVPRHRFVARTVRGGRSLTGAVTSSHARENTTWLNLAYALLCGIPNEPQPAPCPGKLRTQNRQADRDHHKSGPRQHNHRKPEKQHCG